MKSILLLAMAAFIAACSNNQSTNDNHEGHDHGSNAPETASSPAKVNLKDDKLNAVYQHYVHLTKSLTDGNAEEAKIAAVAIEAGAGQIANGKQLATTAAEITSAGDIELQRKSFALLTEHLIPLLKETGLDSGELFVSHCPMALNDKGAYWVSNSKEIQNPYFGESMLTCGSVKETISSHH